MPVSPRPTASLGPDEFETKTRRKLSDSDIGTVIDLMIGHGLPIPLAGSLHGFFDVLIVEADIHGTVVNVQISYAD